MRLGIISVEWLPRHGGAMIYPHRLARQLIRLGHLVSVATGTQCSSTADNGEVEASRAPVCVDPDDKDSVKRWYGTLGPWLRENAFTHVLVNAPLTRVSHAYARELYDMVRKMGALTGALHYDLGRDIASELAWNYGLHGSWTAAVPGVIGKLRNHLAAVHGTQGWFDIESPFFFEPDFVITCSEWSGRFIDPLGLWPRFAFRPWIEPEFSLFPPLHETEMRPVDISFVNPLPHKGADTLTALIRYCPATWSFRILQGGYGDGVRKFLADIRDTAAFSENRIHILEYCRDMRAFFAASKVFIFPSLYEGYGMAAVEALFCGTPVVAREYPAVLEGVGDCAAIVPYTGDAEHWIETIRQVLAERDVWQCRARSRTEFLLKRQQSEMLALVNFLQSL